MNKSVVKPKNQKGLIANPTTIGERMRNRRIELNLLQKDVAKIINVSEDTITNWEIGRFKPQVHYYPPIINFLGFFPFMIDASTIGGKIMKYRFENGLSYKKMAKCLGVDVVTVGHWEKSLRFPKWRKVQKTFQSLKKEIDKSHFTGSKECNECRFDE